MIPMTVANVTRHEKLLRTTVLLVDEPRQRGLLLWFVAERDFVAQLRMSVTTDAKSVMADADYPQLILGIVQALEGTLEVIEIDALEGDILYARVKVRGVDGRARSIKTRLGNALPLLAQARCPAEVAEVVLETQGLRLSDFGGTFEKQVEALARRGEQLFALGASQALSPVRTPRNMDFREGFRGWSFMGYPDKPKHYTYRIAEDITFQGKPSLEIVLEELEHTVEETYLQRFAILMHEGFVADNYRDQRLRMCAYARAAHVEQGVFSLHINGPAPTDAQERKTMYMAGNNEHPIEGTSDWSPYEIVIDVPEDAETIQCSFQIRGYGKVWLDGFRFEIVDRSVPLTGTRVVPPPRQPSNLKFERQFEGWLLVGSRPQDYEKHTEIDESGVRVAHLKNRVELARGNCELQQTINTYDCRGKTVRVTVQARCEELSEQASLYLAAGLANKARIERPLQDDKGWQSYEMSLFIPDEPGQLQFGLRLLGAGQVWLRDVSFAIV